MGRRTVRLSGPWTQTAQGEGLHLCPALCVRDCWRGNPARRQMAAHAPLGAGEMALPSHLGGSKRWRRAGAIFIQLIESEVIPCLLK